MKNLNFITFTAVFVLCFAVFTASGQDTSPDTGKTEIQEEILDEIKEKEKQIEKLEAKIKLLKEKIESIDHTEAREEIEDVIEDLEDEVEDIEDEIEDLEEEIEEEIEEQIERDVESIVEDALDGLDISFKKKKKPLKNVKTRWGMLDLGFSTYFSENTLPEIDGINPLEPDIVNSVSWRIHVVRQRINLVNHHFNLMYGAGFAFNYYGFSNPVTLVPSQPDVTFTLDGNNNFSYKKNHLRTTYLHIPFMLNFESNPHRKSKSFHLNAGVYGNVLMGAKTTQKTNNIKIKTKNKFNLNNFQYGLIANVGYGPVTFYGTLGLNELFKPEKDNGYTVTPITFGLSVLPF